MPLIIHVATVLIVAVSTVAAAGQQAERTFEVVSIKRSAADARGASVGVQPGGRFVMVNASILALIGSAYPTDTSEHLGVPDWLNTERYDVTAVAPPGTTRDDIEPMLRGLLAERFKFKAHYETTERPTYDLVLARADGQLPAGLRKVDVDCEARRAASVRGEKVPELPRLANGLMPCSMNMNGADFMTIRSGGMTLANLARSIQGLVGRVIVDKTGLSGVYEFALSFTSNPQPNSDQPSVFTALQEQLGLKLESSRGPVRVLAIDHIERPTEN